MRKWLAFILRGIAAKIYDDTHRERIAVLDEYEVTRCVVEIVGGIDSETDDLPEGWIVHAWHDGEQYK